MTGRCWFFDLDGTLADTEPDIRRAWHGALDDLRLDCPDFDRKFVTGPSIDEIVRRLFPDRAGPGLIAEIRERFGRHYDHDGFPNTREYPGVLAAVRRLKAAGSRVYIATNKRFAGATLMARHFGWDRVFDGLYTGDMHQGDAIGKLRKPQLLALMLRELGVEPAACVMVGDTINDFEAARANGIESVAVTWGYGREEELREADRRVSLDRLDELA